MAQVDDGSTSDSSSSSGSSDVRHDWEAAEEDMLDLVESLRKRLAQISPGIGDRISLAKFVRFVEVNSTCL